MSFCTNCGKPITGNSKFCPACSANVIVPKRGNNSEDKLSEHNDVVRNKVPTPVRGRANNLFNEKTQDFITGKAQSIVENKTKETIEYYAKKKVDATENRPPISEAIKPAKTSNNASKTSVSSAKKVNKWIWIYAFLSVLLLFMGYQSERIIWLLILSVVILLLVFLRRKKEKPYNWMIKIILVLQLIFLAAFIIGEIEFMSIVSQYFSFFMLLYIGLLVSNMMLLFKGNKS